MRRAKAGLQVATGLMALMAFSSQVVLAKESTTEPGAVQFNSFSGAYLAGRAAEFDNDLERAVTYYERALSFDPGNIILQQSLLLGLISQGRFDEALPYADALQAEPDVERFSRLALAVDAFRKDDFPDAERWLKLVVESDLDKLITRIMTAWASVGQGDVEAALKQVDQIEGPSFYDFFKNYQNALILAHSGRKEEATQAFQSVLNDFAGPPVAPHTLGRVVEVYVSFLSHWGDKDGALAVLDKADESGLGLASLMTLRERLEAGETLQPAVTSVQEGAAEVLLNLATQLAATGGDSLIRLYLHYALALDPDDDAILVQLARVAERQGESENAIALYGRIDENSPWKRAASYQIGLNLADLDRFDEAEKHLQDVLESDPSDLRAYLALGGVYAAQKDFASAAALYDRAVEQIDEPSREHWNIYYQRGIAYERLKQWEKAEPNFLTALELYPDQPQVLNYLGYSWIDKNMKLEEGMELIRRAVELRPSDGYIVDSLGWAHYRLGEYEEAVEHLERAVSLRPDDPILNDHLGDGYWRADRRLEAQYQWSHVLNLEPEPELRAEVRKKLEEGLPPEQDKKVANAGAMFAVDDDAAGGDDRQDKDPRKEAAADSQQQSATPTSLFPPEDAASHVVESGETLWSIAEEYLGDGARYLELLRINPQFMGNPNRLEPGQSVELPADAR